MFLKVEDVTGKSMYINFNLVEYVSKGKQHDIVIKLPTFALYITMESWNSIKDELINKVRLQ